MAGLPGLEQIEQDKDRVIFEDTQAAPLVYAAAHPATPCSMSYSGNSLLIPLRGIDSRFPFRWGQPRAGGIGLMAVHGCARPIKMNG